jgi:hypothetical protein
MDCLRQKHSFHRSTSNYAHSHESRRSVVADLRRQIALNLAPEALARPLHVNGSPSASPKIEVEQDCDKPAQEFNIAADCSTRKLRASQLIKESQP